MIKFRIKELEVRSFDPKNKQDRNRQSTRVYVWIVNDERDKPVMDIVTGFRYNKPYELYRKFVMPAVILAMGQPSNTKFRWSQYAGCSCPCSPGFIVEQIGEPKNVFVKVEAYEESPELCI